MPDNVSLVNLPTVDVPVAIPFAADLARVIATTTAAIASAPLVLQLRKNGTDVFASPVAKIFLNANATSDPTNPPVGLLAADTTVLLEFYGNAAPDIEPGEYLKIGTEYVQVTSPVTSGTGLTTGGVQGSSKVDGGTPVYKVGITRGALGSTPADANSGTDVFPAFVVAVGDAETKVRANPVEGSTPTFAAGDEASFHITSGTIPSSGTAQVVLELVQR